MYIDMVKTLYTKLILLNYPAIPKRRKEKFTWYQPNFFIRIMHAYDCNQQTICEVII